ncbi:MULTISPECIES: hypothetical protein [unclassified Bacillus (in: firmicutes)]|uniref:hypothetical protein n=1 Tax=unclassified Bacillus (in: firmicutes) TaxID=185979 RepID=UPI0015CF330B|nr:MULTISPECIES: hypothetical protein [unclassified Bacillus (in: firmicutes)]
MEKKPVYYDGSGDWEDTTQPIVIKNLLSIDPEIRKSLAANPYEIDWNQVKEK